MKAPKPLAAVDHLGCALAAVQALTTSLHAARGGEDR